MEYSADLAVIGAGPAGYAAALRASRLNMKVILVEKAKEGGTCLNWGCIPAKSLLYSAALLIKMKNAARFGLNAEKVFPDFNAVIQRSRACADRLGGGVALLLKNRGVHVIRGEAFFQNPSVLEVRNPAGETTDRITAANVLIATGAHPKILSDTDVNGKTIWTSSHALMPEKQPASLIILGGGAIGMEMASFYAAMGTKVTVLEGFERVLPAEDPEISEAVRKSYTRRGVAVRCGVKILSVKDVDGEQACVVYEKDGIRETMSADVVLTALGVAPNTRGIGLENTAVQVSERGGIVTDGRGRTDEPSVFAAGDVTAPPFLAHKALRQGVLAVECMARRDSLPPLDETPMPACTFCFPQVASVGMTEEKALQNGWSPSVGRFPLIGNGKSVVMGDTEGFVKVVSDTKTGKILGAHMVGEGVCELIGAFSEAIAADLTVSQMKGTVFPHPTQSEMLEEAILATRGEALHI